MKKICFACIIMGFLMLGACKKSNCGTGGSWTLRTQNYQVCMCAINANRSELYGEEQTVSPTTNQFIDHILGLYFFNAVPATSDTLMAVVHDTTATQVTLQVLGANGPTGATTYISTGGTVFVSVSGGKLYAKGSGITMVNVWDTSDIQTLSLDIHQTE